jgi:hypothetical protein
MSNSQALAHLKRRRQLEKQRRNGEFDANFPSKIKRIVSGPIATAEGILNNWPPSKISPILRGTCAKQLSAALASVQGYRNVPSKTMRSLIKRLCPCPIVYPYAELPPKTHDEEVLEIIDEILRQHFPFWRHEECTPVAKRLLKLLNDTFDGSIPAHARKYEETLAKFVPEYKPKPNWNAQFEAHQTLSEQLSQMNNHTRYLQAMALLNAKPQGHA